MTVTDDEDHTETQVINLIVASVNDPGSFSGNTSATGSEDESAITGTLAFTDAIDGDSVPNYIITSESSNGTASIDATTGAWSYTPNANFNGSDSFTVTVTDDDGHTETQVISLIVEAVNDPGSFTGDTRQRQAQKTILLSQARSSSLMPSTVTLFPTTPLRQSRTTVQHPSTPLPEHGRTRQTPTSTAQILLL